MHRWFWYGAGMYFSSSKITSALVTGLVVADLAYTAQTALLGIGPWAALSTATVVFKTASAAAYIMA